MTLGQKLRKLRNDKGITQKDLADQLHVTFQTISKWESDKNEPDLATLKEIANYFNVTLDYIASDKEDSKDSSPSLEQQEVVLKETPQEVVTKTVIIHQNDLHVCAKCGKDIQEKDLVAEDITKDERYGRISRTVTIGQTYYHKECLNKVKKERELVAKEIRRKKVRKVKHRAFGWGIGVGVATLVISLVLFILNYQIVHPALGVLYSVIIGYGFFASLYCIITQSYIFDVFIWCATSSIKLPGLIFSLDLDGIIWFITVKITLSIIAFLFGVLALFFGIGVSFILSVFSFPFVLIHNIKTDYDNAI